MVEIENPYARDSRTHPYGSSASSRLSSFCNAWMSFVAACGALGLQRALKFHQERLRAIPRTFSSDCDARCNLLARSAGVSRNCSISSVRSTPYFCAASIRLPGAGFRSLCSARTSSSAVNFRSIIATVPGSVSSQTCRGPSHACAGRPGTASWRAAISRRYIRG